MKNIWVVAGCFNEEGNITELYERVKKIFSSYEQYEFTLLLIDNDSQDKTREEIEALCARDQRVKAIFNSRNFGHIRSPFYAFTQAQGDAVITAVSDLQVDPEIIHEYLKKWEQGSDIVIGVRQNNVDTFFLRILKNLFYRLICRISEIKLRRNFIGLGLYDKKVVDAIKKINDPYPYFRGLVFEVGFKIDEVPYTYHGRKRGISSNNLLSLYDLGVLGIVTHTKIPLRLATISGFLFSAFFFLVGLFYLCYKLLYWKSFRLGMAPMMIGVFFTASLQLMFLGILGEYVGFIFTKVQNRPLVIEAKRINF